ncbi:PepSY-associated TM helix domain protein [Chitinophaga pinensis DSM 2588]|uniref:PepSY-associated TM helix domain protein n=2 Tax=Chitinophaga pinensis TaxID=79329 RepID=A0A979G4D6_CHIPD|nr:PepSY-associated TM helix domain protein [Chitinophaga pinensis DSM 2588]
MPLFHPPIIFQMFIKQLKKIILLLHRYLGFVLSLLFVIWFISGFVMMYVSYPTMKYHQRLQQLPAVNMDQCHLSAKQAITAAQLTDTVTIIRLGMLLNRPIYRIVTQKNKHLAVFADNGELLPEVDTALASQIAQAFVGGRSRPASVEKLTQIDQWMAAHRSQGYLPQVYRFKMDDLEKTYVYVSIYTGEVVQMLNARQRFLAWLGPVPHWIYPTVLIRNRPLWSQVVIWVSLIGVIMSLTGIVMGFIRYKRKKKQSIAFSPYKKPWFRYHHYTGFVFGIFIFTWILSGLFSMSPVDFGPDSGKILEEHKRLSGGPLNTSAFTLSPAQAWNVFKPLLTVKEIQLIQVLGKPYYLAYQDYHHTRLLAADQADGLPFDIFSSNALTEQIQTFQPGQAIQDTVVMNSYDNYYYSRTYEKRLPVLRIRMNNPEKSWYYIDLKTGQLALKHEKGSRIERWLYHGLHSLDFGFLVYKRPLWDTVMWLLLFGGLLVSITGLVLTGKWIKRKAKKISS